MNRQRTPVLAEFVGFPGAGKTTVARHAVRRLRAQRDIDPFFYSKDGKLRAGPGDVAGGIALAIRAAGRFLLTTVPSQGLRQMRRAARILDRVLTTRRARTSRDELADILELLRDDLAEIYVFIDTPPELAARRCIARDKRSLQRFFTDWSIDRVSALYREQNEVLESMARWLQEQPQTTVIRLDGTHKPAVIAEELARRLTDLLRGRRNRKDAFLT